MVLKFFFEDTLILVLMSNLSSYFGSLFNVVANLSISSSSSNLLN